MGSSNLSLETSAGAVPTGDSKESGESGPPTESLCPVDSLGSASLCSPSASRTGEPTANCMVGLSVRGFGEPGSLSRWQSAIESCFAKEDSGNFDKMSVAAANAALGVAGVGGGERGNDACSI